VKKRDRKALGEYIRWVANEMELRDWTFTVAREASDEAHDASVSITYGRKRAQIYVSADFRAFDPGRQTHTIVHELVHCHLDSACGMVRNDLEEHLGKQADRLFWDAFRRQMEYGVDALADAIAKHLPPIKWPDRAPSA
jgi:hypothetical protein